MTISAALSYLIYKNNMVGSANLKWRLEISYSILVAEPNNQLILNI